MIEVRYSSAATGKTLSREVSNPWVALLTAQRLSTDWQIDIYIWDDGIPVATVHPHGAVMVTI